MSTNYGTESLHYHQRPITHGTACTSEALALLQRDTQERAQRVIEAGAAAARYVVTAGACAAMARKELSSFGESFRTPRPRLNVNYVVAS